MGFVFMLIMTLSFSRSFGTPPLLLSQNKFAALESLMIFFEDFRLNNLFHNFALISTANPNFTLTAINRTGLGSLEHWAEPTMP